MTQNILLSNHQSTTVVTLNRTEKLNAWNTAMRVELSKVLGELNADDGIRAIVITGAGDRAFSAGQDLEETMQFSSGEEALAWFLTWREFYDSLRQLDKPCLAALNGVAAGSAFSLPSFLGGPSSTGRLGGSCPKTASIL